MFDVAKLLMSSYLTAYSWNGDTPQPVGNDLLRGGPGNDYLDGGPGIDSRRPHGCRPVDGGTPTDLRHLAP